MINKTTIGAIVAIAVIVIAALLLSRTPENDNPEYAALAVCLAEKKVTMYGAYWCPHCQEQKKMFGRAFSQLPYVECTKEPKRCVDAHIENYPTWVFPDGRRVEGVLDAGELAEISGCEQ